MRTNVVIDDDLMREALEATGLPTKRAVIEEALRTLVQACAARDLVALGGQVEWEGVEDRAPDAWAAESPRAQAQGN